jgi:hypothetical protein
MLRQPAAEVFATQHWGLLTAVLNLAIRPQIPALSVFTMANYMCHRALVPLQAFLRWGVVWYGRAKSDSVLA